MHAAMRLMACGAFPLRHRFVPYVLGVIPSVATAALVGKIGANAHSVGGVVTTPAVALDVRLVQRPKPRWWKLDNG